MRSLPVVFRECHRLRRHIRELDDELERAPKSLKIQQNRLANKETALKETQDAIQKLKLALREHDVSLKASFARLKKCEEQLGSAANTKEYDAKQLEIDHARKTAAGLEEDILLKMNELEERTKKLPEVEAALVKAREEFATYETDAKKRLERMAKERKQSEEKLAEVEKEIPLIYRDQYARLVKAHGPDALAEVVGKSCGHCRSSVTMQQDTDLNAGIFMCCSRCGRALYPVAVSKKAEAIAD